MLPRTTKRIRRISSITAATSAAILTSSAMDVSVDALVPHLSAVIPNPLRTASGRGQPIFSSYLDQLSSSDNSPAPPPTPATDAVASAAGVEPELVTELRSVPIATEPASSLAEVAVDQSDLAEAFGLIFHIISEECGGDGPTERGIGAVYTYLDAIASGKVTTTPSGLALVGKYICSLSPDGETLGANEAIALYITSLSTGGAKLPSLEKFTSYLNKIFVTDVNLPQAEADILAFFGAASAPPISESIAPYKNDTPAAAPESGRVEEAFPGTGGVWRTSSGKVVPPPIAAPPAPGPDIWKDVVSEADAQAVSEARRIFVGGSLVFAGIALVAGANSIFQNMENEEARNVGAVKQDVAMDVRKVDKQNAKDVVARGEGSLDVTKNSEALKRIAEHEAAEEKRIAEQEAVASKIAEEQREAEEKAQRVLSDEAKDRRLAEEMVARQEEAKTAAKADFSEDKAAPERDAVDEYGSFVEEITKESAKSPSTGTSSTGTASAPATPAPQRKMTSFSVYSQRL